MTPKEYEVAINKNRNIIAWIIGKIVRNKDDVDDILQEVAIKLWGMHETVEPECKNLLCRMAYSVTIDYIRKNKRFTTNIDTVFDMGQIVDRDSDLGDRVHAKIVVYNDIPMVIRSDGQRKVYEYLIKNPEESNNEVSRETGISPSNVSRHKGQIKYHLKKLYEKDSCLVAGG